MKSFFLSRYNCYIYLINHSNMASSKSTSGLSTTMVLFLIFLTLKLTGLISWSWWWVTSPLWIPVMIILTIMFIALGAIIIATALGYSMKDIKNKIKKE